MYLAVHIASSSDLTSVAEEGLTEVLFFYDSILLSTVAMSK